MKNKLYFSLARNDGQPDLKMFDVVCTLAGYAYQCFHAEPGQDEAGVFMELDVQYVGPVGYEERSAALLAMALGQSDIRTPRQAFIFA
jgi:hypothetical protein